MARSIIIARLALSAAVVAVIASCAASEKRQSERTADTNTAADGNNNSTSTSSNSSLVSEVSSVPGTAQAKTPPPIPPELTPKSADQHLLRDMVDNHEAMILLAHAAMEQRHDHKMGDDPALSEDVNQDAAKTEMVLLLRSSYMDLHEPRPSPADRAAVDSIMALKGDAYDNAFRNFMLQRDELGINMIKRALPKLRNPKVKMLAERMRGMHMHALKAKK